MIGLATRANGTRLRRKEAKGEIVPFEPTLLTKRAKTKKGTIPTSTNQEVTDAMRITRVSCCLESHLVKAPATKTPATMRAPTRTATAVTFTVEPILAWPTPSALLVAKCLG